MFHISIDRSIKITYCIVKIVTLGKVESEDSSMHEFI